MGAWGVLAFDNDTACDWAHELDEVDDLSLVDSAFIAVENVGDAYLDQHDACNALAACEVLARLRGNDGYRNPYTEPVDAWVAAHKIVPDIQLLTRALRVIERILAENSELRELWEEDGGTEWRDAVGELRQRLRA